MADWRRYLEPEVLAALRPAMPVVAPPPPFFEEPPFAPEPPVEQLPPPLVGFSPTPGQTQAVAIAVQASPQERLAATDRTRVEGRRPSRDDIFPQPFLRRPVHLERRDQMYRLAGLRRQ